MLWSALKSPDKTRIPNSVIPTIRRDPAQILGQIRDETPILSHFRCCRKTLRIILAAFFLTAPAHAQNAITSSPIVQTQLLVNAPLIKRGAAVDAAVRFTIPPDWHIYWRNPGDSGIATTLDWKLPAGISAGDIQWPAPERIDTSGLINYVYSNTVTLPVKLTAAGDGIIGEVSVKASWMVCKEICIPESANLSAMLNADTQAAGIIAAAYKKIPHVFIGKAVFDATVDAVKLTITQDNPWGSFDSARFSPVEDGVMVNYPPGEVKQVGNELTITAPRGAADAIDVWHGVLHITADGREMAWDVTATSNAAITGNGGGVDSTSTARKEAEPAAPIAPRLNTLVSSLILAFLGGLILNIMPCVLPILALKALALSKKAAALHGAAIRQGISYTAGVVMSFLIIAGVMLALKATGSAIGWGFQLQNTGFVAFLAVIMLLVSANLLGLFELPVLFGAKATGVDEEKLSGSFLTGVLAVLVATPCTAPFMATAIGATLAMPTAQALAVFAALGLGMAAPFLIISVWPAARRLLPRPGAWMNRFKQLLAIPMLATTAWLIFVLAQLLHPSPIASGAGYAPYSAMRLSELREAGTPVLVEATAAWCLTCKVNERVALFPTEMQQFFRDENVTILIADWTGRNPQITAYLASFGRNGVPLYVYYPPHGEPVILPQIIAPSIIRKAIRQGRE